MLLIADARIPARDDRRNRLKVTGIKSLVKTQAQSHSGEAVRAEKDLLFRPHRCGFVQFRITRLLIPATRRLIARVIARRMRAVRARIRDVRSRTRPYVRKKNVFW